MMRHLALPAVVAALLLAAPAAFATPVETFDLVTNAVGSTGTAGTVTLTQVSSTQIDIEVQLAAGVYFANTGGPHTPFAFNLDSSTLSLATVAVTSPTKYFEALSGAQSATPYGTFTNGIGCTAACGGGTSGKITGPLDITVTVPTGDTISFSDFIANTSKTGDFYVEADLLGLNGKTGTFASGSVASCVDCGGGEGNVPPSVPEPAAAALLAFGLAGLAVARRTRRAA